MNRLFSAIVLTGFAALFSGTAVAKTCELSISGDDNMQFDKSELTVAADCDKVTLMLEHTGKMDIGQMGHNWVLSETSDFEEAAQDAQQAGRDNEYIPQDDERIIAHTGLVGGGESTSVTFDVSELKPGEDYTYFCSFPGHYVSMNGKLIVEK